MVYDESIQPKTTKQQVLYSAKQEKKKKDDFWAVSEVVVLPPRVTPLRDRSTRLLQYLVRAPCGGGTAVGLLRCGVG